MRIRTLTTQEFAEVAHVRVETLHQMFTHPQFASFRPAKAYNGQSATMNGNQTLLSLIATDLVRFEVKAPLAGTIATRVAESLLFNPDASAVHIEFRANGASFAFTTEDAPDAANAAGPRRFRLTFDLSEYRAAVNRAMGTADGA